MESVVRGTLGIGWTGAADIAMLDRRRAATVIVEPALPFLPPTTALQ